MYARHYATAALAVALTPFALAQAGSPSAAGLDQRSDVDFRAPEPQQQYTQTNLVSNHSGGAAVTDPNLVNAWGMSRSSGSPWWVSDNGTGLSTLYDGTGKVQGLVVKIPPSDPNVSSTGTPTGTIFNGTKDFAVGPAAPGIFLFATEDGTISGWNPAVNSGSAVIEVNEKTASVFKGLTMAQASLNGGPLANYLYAADFRHGRVAVFDAAFHHAGQIERAFERIYVRGFAPFNVQNIGGNIYVAYAMQDDAKHDEVDGAGKGAVAVFRPDGRLIQVLENGSWFNAPWGMAVAPSDFGAYSHDLLIGNFGSGEILAFNPVNGRFKGRLRDSKNNSITIDGLWGLSFGSGGGSGAATSLYFAAGPNHEQDGLLGMITAIQNAAGNGQ